MITSLRVNNTYNIGINSQNMINVSGVSVRLQDIPFIRYNFNSYSEKEINYIKESMGKFAYSTHLIQLHLNENITNSLTSIQTYASDIINKIVKFLYIDITTDEVLNDEIDNLKLQNIANICNTLKFDRIMLVDKTTNLDMVHANRFRTTIAKTTNTNISKLGICSSPLCLEGDLCCLTAVRARELMAQYGKAETSLPTANHQCMNCCGCIRFYDIDSDVEAPAVIVKDASKDSSNIDDYMNPPKEEKKEKKAKEKQPKEKKEKQPKEKIDKGKARIKADKELRKLF